MKKLSKLFATVLGLGLAVGVFAGLSNKSVEPVKATAAQSDVDEFTHNGQFTYSAIAGVGTLQLMSAEDVAQEGILESGYEGAVLKAVNTAGGNSAVKLDYTGSGILASDVARINFKVYAHDPSSTLTQLDLRIRKGHQPGVDDTVVNKNSTAGYSMLNSRNTWVNYALTPSQFNSGYSYEYFADSNGYLTFFELFFRIKSSSISIYIDSVDVYYYGDYGMATISDVKTDFVSPTTYDGATTYTLLNNVSPFAQHSVSVSFGLNIPNGVGIQLDMTACKAWDQPYYSIRINTSGSNAMAISLLYNGASVDTAYGTISLDTDHIITFRSILLDSTKIALEFLVDNVSVYSYVGTYAAENTGRVLIFTLYENAAGVKVFDADVNAQALARFAKRQLHTDTIPTSDRTEGNACRGENGYYAKAASFYTNYLTKNQKVAFATNDTYEQERERMTAWAAANGTSISFNPTSGEIVPANALTVFGFDSSNKGSVVIIIASITLAIGVMLFFFLFRKKKQEQ